MFTLGILSFIQITLLPGILILKFFKINKGILQNLIYTFGLSLITNYLLVFVITTIGINISYSFYFIFSLELLAIFMLYSSSLSNPLEITIGSKKTEFIEYITSLRILNKKGDQYDLSQILIDVVSIVFIALALSSIWWAFKVWFTNVDTVFTQWDAVVSWNRWATNWFSGIFPTRTHRYAQLIPTNFAVSYAFLGGVKIQFFAKSIMPLFNLFILLLMFDLGLEYKNSGYFIGVVATRYIIKKFLGEYIASGYVDVALAFFTFVTVYTLLKAKNQKNQSQMVRYLRIGFIFAAGAALTKQNGLFVFGLYPLLAYSIIQKDLDELNKKQQIRNLTKWFAISLCIILPWYLFNEYRIFTGSLDTNVGYLIGGRHEGRDLLDRFMRAVGLLEKYSFLYIFILLMLPFLESTLIWITLALLIPYSLIWAVAFSTFARNLAIALPLLGMMTGLSAQKLVEYTSKLTLKLKLDQLKIYFVIGIIALIAIISSLFVPDSSLINHQEEQQKEILLSFINHQIYDYFEKIGHFEPIMTNYPISHLPGMEDLQIDIDNFSNASVYHQVIDSHPEVSLILVFENRADEQVLQEITQKLENGDFELIFKDGKYSLIKIINR